jgi:hypothetical protein
VRMLCGICHTTTAFGCHFCDRLWFLVIWSGQRGNSHAGTFCDIGHSDVSCRQSQRWQVV